MRLRTLLVAPPLLALPLLAACGPSPTAAPTPSPPPEPAATATPPPETAGVSADIQDFAFKAQSITVAVGTTVTWTHRDAVPHTVTSTETPPGQGFHSGLMSQGQSFSFTFTVPGTYQYFCTIHPFMTGKVIVG